MSPRIAPVLFGFVLLALGLVSTIVMATLVVGPFGSLVVITAGYALFQAANNTAVMANATPDRRGLTSALLGLARNLGLVTGASAMGAVFAIASGGVAVLHLPAGRETGLALTFGLGALLAAAALLVVVRSRRHIRPHPERRRDARVL